MSSQRPHLRCPHAAHRYAWIAQYADAGPNSSGNRYWMMLRKGPGAFAICMVRKLRPRCFVLICLPPANRGIVPTGHPFTDVRWPAFERAPGGTALLQWGCIVTEPQFPTKPTENPVNSRRNFKNITPERAKSDVGWWSRLHTRIESPFVKNAAREPFAAAFSANARLHSARVVHSKRDACRITSRGRRRARR
ncbi:hypothetical protein AWB74_01662 [Caballeronia arvi]|uniref:Uncharacterized protein n=1 Tax=Caballeronia arvi TaxID=1777135 RepID=A0A158HBG0_9BURK|nr:hypothetical protein AWB74_01662 [Caballeronia arvi]